MKSIDWSRPYATNHGGGSRAKYEQDGKKFDAHGNLLNDDGSPIPDPADTVIADLVSGGRQLQESAASEDLSGSLDSPIAESELTEKPTEAPKQKRPYNRKKRGK